MNGPLVANLPRQKAEIRMKTAKTAILWTIARPVAGACLLVGVSGCALIPGLRDVVTQEAERRPRAVVEGVPPALAAKANDLVRVAEPSPRSVLEARNRINQSSELLRDLLARVHERSDMTAVNSDAMQMLKGDGAAFDRKAKEVTDRYARE